MPGGEVLAALALQGVDVNFVLTGTGVQTQPPLKMEEWVLLDYFRKASAERRDAALGALLGVEGGVRVQMHNSGVGGVQVGHVGGKVTVKGKR